MIDIKSILLLAPPFVIPGESLSDLKGFIVDSSYYDDGPVEQSYYTDGPIVAQGCCNE